MKKWLFDALRYAQIIIPGLAACYATLAGIWGWNYAEAVVASAAAVTTLIGIILKIDSTSFFKENIIVPVDEEKGE